MINRLYRKLKTIDLLVYQHIMCMIPDFYFFLFLCFTNNRWTPKNLMVQGHAFSLPLCQKILMTLMLIWDDKVEDPDLPTQSDAEEVGDHSFEALDEEEMHPELDPRQAQGKSGSVLIFKKFLIQVLYPLTQSNHPSSISKQCSLTRWFNILLYRRICTLHTNWVTQWKLALKRLKISCQCYSSWGFSTSKPSMTTGTSNHVLMR